MWGAAILGFGTGEVLAIVVASSFAAGLNVYATVATLGLLARGGVLPLPPSLHVVETWPVITAALVMFVIELFADKVPGFDLIWNALHTFVRVPVAALLSYGATAQLSPGAQLAAATLGGLIALASHGGKTAMRVAVTPSPEPISNIALSTGEDVIAVGLVWFATAHPIIAAVLVAAMIVIIVVLVRWVASAFRYLFRGARRQIDDLENSANR